MGNVNRTILLVEDQSLIAMAEAVQLNHLGYDVVVSNSAEGAIELIENDDIIDLVLMDIDLGNGMNGLEAAEIILSKFHIPVVFLSSNNDPQTVSKAKQISKYGYMVKSTAGSVLQYSIEHAFRIYDNI